MSVDILEFTVLGEPVPEGSTKAFYIKKLNKTVTTHQNQKSLVAWRQRVATEAQHTIDGKGWRCDAISAYTVDVTFMLARPTSIPEWKRIAPIVKPDIDKLIRAINDALTGVLFHDDCQVVEIHCIKDYDAERSGVKVKVSRMDNVGQRPKRKR